MAPIAITFSDDRRRRSALRGPAAPMPEPTPDGRTGRVPAGCVFWVHALDRTFTTGPRITATAASGASPTDSSTWPPPRSAPTSARSSTSGWVTPEIFPSIPVVTTRPEAITYGPLADAATVARRRAACAPTPAGVMTIGDALDDLVIEGKPQCHIVAIAKEQNRPAASVGCALEPGPHRDGRPRDDLRAAGVHASTRSSTRDRAAGRRRRRPSPATPPPTPTASRSLLVSELAPLTDRNLGWLRYLHRKATTADSWEREGHPHEHWDNTSEAPMLCYHRFDLIDSTYAVALMADRTPGVAGGLRADPRRADLPPHRLVGGRGLADPDRRRPRPGQLPRPVPDAHPRRRTGATTTSRAGPRTASSRGACSGIRSAPTGTSSSRASSSSCSASTGV